MDWNKPFAMENSFWWNKRYQEWRLILHLKKVRGSKIMFHVLYIDEVLSIGNGIETW